MWSRPAARFTRVSISALSMPRISNAKAMFWRTVIWG